MVITALHELQPIVRLTGAPASGLCVSLLIMAALLDVDDSLLLDRERGQRTSVHWAR